MGENCFSKYGSVGQYLKLLYLENAPKAFVDLEPSYSTIIYSQYFVFSAPSRLQYIHIYIILFSIPLQSRPEMGPFVKELTPDLLSTDLASDPGCLHTPTWLTAHTHTWDQDPGPPLPPAWDVGIKRSSEALPMASEYTYYTVFGTPNVYPSSS